MEVKINVDESRIPEILEKELNALNAKEIHEIVIECIKQYLSQDNYKNTERLFVYKEKDRYGYTQDTPTDLLYKILKENIDYSSLQNTVDKCIDELKNNYESLLIKVITEMIATSLANTYNMRGILSEIINQKLIK
jgi:hypothetical protein